MTIAVEAVARERDGEAEINVASGEFTFVALDATGQAAEQSRDRKRNHG